MLSLKGHEYSESHNSTIPRSGVVKNVNRTSTITIPISQPLPPTHKSLSPVEISRRFSNSSKSKRPVNQATTSIPLSPIKAATVQHNLISTESCPHKSIHLAPALIGATPHVVSSSLRGFGLDIAITPNRGLSAISNTQPLYSSAEGRASGTQKEGVFSPSCFNVPSKITTCRDTERNETDNSVLLCLLPKIDNPQQAHVPLIKDNQTDSHLAFQDVLSQNSHFLHSNLDIPLTVDSYLDIPLTVDSNLDIPLTVDDVLQQLDKCV